MLPKQTYTAMPLSLTKKIIKGLYNVSSKMQNHLLSKYYLLRLVVWFSSFTPSYHLLYSVEAEMLPARKTLLKKVFVKNNLRKNGKAKSKLNFEADVFFPL